MRAREFLVGEAGKRDPITAPRRPRCATNNTWGQLGRVTAAKREMRIGVRGTEDSASLPYALPLPVHILLLAGDSYDPAIAAPVTRGSRSGDRGC